MQISLNIVTYNAEKWIKACLDSVFAQTYKDFEVFVVDNASSDNTCKIISENYQQVNLAKSDKNVGFTGGHNLAINKSSAPIVLMINQDIILAPDFLEQVVHFFESHQKCAAITGKNMLLDATTMQKTNKFDSLGIVAKKCQRFYERGVKQEDKGQYDQEQEVFGVSGAAPAYRRAALEDVKYQDEYLDKNFFMYKEDVDLSYRLRWRGWQVWYTPKAVCYHARTVIVKTGVDDVNTALDRHTKSGQVNYWSYRNHILTLKKNLSKKMWQSWWLRILFYEFKKIIYCIVLERKTLSAWKEMKKLKKEYLSKRNHIMENRKISDKEMMSWFS